VVKLASGAVSMDFLVLAANVSCGFDNWCPALAYHVPAAKTVLPPDLLASLSKAALGVAAGVGGVATIRQKRRERARLGRSIDSRTLAEKLAKHARLGAAPSLADAQVDVLASTLEGLHLAAERRMAGMREAITMLHESKFEAVEQILAAAGKTSAAPGTPAAKRAAEAFRHLGNIALLHDADAAKQAYAMAVELNPEDAAALFSLGKLQKQAGDLDAAARSFERMLALGNRTGRHNIVAGAASNLFPIFQTRGDFSSADAILRRGLAATEELGDEEATASLYGCLGGNWLHRGDLAEAEAMHRKSLRLFEELEVEPGIASQYGDLGTVHRMRGDFDLAEAMYKKSLAVSEPSGLTELSANQHTHLGSLYMQRGDVIQAGGYWRKARELYRQIGMKPQADQIDALLRGGNFPAAS
jgi:tetratricopeptide (TPR) repeat protein